MGDGVAGAAGLLAFAFISFCNLFSSFFKAAKSDAVGGGADAVAAAATDGSGRETGEGEGGVAKREERGRSERERSICNKYFFAFAYV